MIKRYNSARQSCSAFTSVGEQNSTQFRAVSTNPSISDPKSNSASHCRNRFSSSMQTFTRASINCSTMARNSSSTFGSTSSDLRAALRLAHEYAPMLAPNQLNAVTTPRLILLSVRTIIGRFRDLTASDAPLRCVEEIEPSAEQAKFALNLPFCRTSTYCAQVSASMTPALVNEARTSPTMCHSWGSLELKLRYSLFMMHELRVQYKMRGSPPCRNRLPC